MKLPRVLLEKVLQYQNPETKVNLLYKEYLRNWLLFVVERKRQIQSFYDVYALSAQYGEKDVLIKLCQDFLDEFVFSGLTKMRL